MLRHYTTASYLRLIRYAKKIKNITIEVYICFSLFSAGYSDVALFKLEVLLPLKVKNVVDCRKGDIGMSNLLRTTVVEAHSKGNITFFITFMTLNFTRT